jgi:type II secretory pathway component PulJ
LRGTVASEQVLRRHDGEAARLRRFIALWRADLAQAQALGTRDAEGARVPAFRVGGAGGLVQLVRGGRPNPEGLARGPLEKLVWRWDGQALVRVAFEQPDGSARTRRWRFCRWPARRACGCATGPGSGARWAIRDGRRHPMACRWRCRSNCARRGWRALAADRAGRVSLMADLWEGRKRRDERGRPCWRFCCWWRSWPSWRR